MKICLCSLPVSLSIYSLSLSLLLFSDRSPNLSLPQEFLSPSLALSPFLFPFLSISLSFFRSPSLYYNCSPSLSPSLCFYLASDHSLSLSRYCYYISLSLSSTISHLSLFSLARRISLLSHVNPLSWVLLSILSPSFSPACACVCA